MGSRGAEDALVIISRPDDDNDSQTLRMTVILSAITSQPAKIENIRALKKNPGKIFSELVQLSPSFDNSVH